MVEDERDGEQQDTDVLTPSREVGGDEGQPDDQRGGHAHRDEPRLVEVVRKFPGLEGEDGTEGDKDEVVGQEGR